MARVACFRVESDTGIVSRRNVALGLTRRARLLPKARALVRPTETCFLAVVQVQGAKRVLNTPTYCSKKRSRHAPRTQIKGLSIFFGDLSTLKSGGVCTSCTSVGQRHHCLLCKLEGARGRCAGAALSSEGSFRIRDIQCGPRSLRAVMLGFSFYGSRRRPV